jgi:predicted permease
VPRSDDDFAREIETHIALETERLVEQGLTPEDARAAARRRFGNVTRTREQFHDARRVAWVDDLRKDAAYALRSLARGPGFAVVTTLTLALGIGANTTIFSVVNAVLVRPLPYPAADRLVTIVENRPAAETFDGRPARRPPLGDEIRALAGETQTLESVESYGPAPTIRLPGREEEEGLKGARASGPLLTMLGARAVLGRLYSAGERDDPVLVLSYETWRRDFGSDPQVLGRTLIVENGNIPDRRTSEPYAVIGVVAEGFSFPDSSIGYWMPRGGVTNLARLKDGVSPESATEEVNRILHQVIGKPMPPPGSGAPRFELVGLQDGVVGPVRVSLRILAIAVGLVLLIACANVANLLLSRAAARQREIAVRAALGARRGRLVRQLLTESVVLALIGGTAGIALAYGGVELLRVLLQGFARPDGRIVRQIGAEMGTANGFPRLDEIALDSTALVFTLALSLVTGILFGLAPALQHVVRTEADALRDGSGTSWGGLRLVSRNATRALFVVAEVAMAMVLLAGGGLMIHSFLKLSTAERGYEAGEVLTFQVRRPVSRSSPADLLALSEQLAADLSQSPGIVAAAYASQLPMVALKINLGFATSPGERLPEAPTGPTPATPYFPDVRVVAPDYFRTLGIRFLAGRTFNPAETGEGQQAIIVNREFARTRFGGQNPVGRQLFGPGKGPWQIVGLVDDVRQQGADRPPEPQVFIGFRQSPLRFVAFSHYYAVRTVGDPRAALPAVRLALERRDREATLENVATMDELVAYSMTRPRAYALLLGIFAALAVTLAAIGIYGVMSYAVAQSTREVGIRVALGAERRAVVGLIVRQGMVLAGAGVAIGLAVAVGAARFLSGMVFGLTPLDVPTYVAVVLLFAAVALLASYVPARRALSVDPLVALRHE